MFRKLKKREKFYRFCCKLLIKAFYDIEYIGFEKIPKNSPALIIANHVSYIDGLMLQIGVNRPIRYMIDKRIYNLPIVHYFMKINRAIPILPKKEAVEKALDKISVGLENGDLICIFPEGRITYTGNLGRFKPGIEWIIERDPVPIYPIAISGLWGSMYSRKYIKSRYRWFPKGFRSKITLRCGDAIHPGHVRVNHLQRIILELKNKHE